MPPSLTTPPATTPARSPRVAVLGGGISGCAVAAELARGGMDVTLIERAPRLGGLHRSVSAGDHVFDIGAFVFGEKHSIFELFPGLLENFPRVSNHFGSVRPGAFVDDYPLTLRGVREQFGRRFLARCLAEITLGKLLYRRRASVPEWSKYYIGPSLYERSGLRTYIERLYLSPHDEIGLEFAEKRMGAVASSAGLRNILRKGAERLLRGQSLRGVLQPETAHTMRVRPEKGFDEAYQCVDRILGELGVTVLCGAAVQRVERIPGGFELAGLGEGGRFDHLFSTIPLELMARLLGLSDFAVPQYVDVYSLYFELAGPIRFPHNVLHNFTDHGQWKRMTVFSRYYGRHQGRHYFTIEGTAKTGRDPREVQDEAVRDFEHWLERERLFEGRPIFLDGSVTRRGYPVYRTETAAAVAELRRRVQEQGVIVSGRQGAFDYISSWDAAAGSREIVADFLQSRAAKTSPGSERHRSVGIVPPFAEA